MLIDEFVNKERLNWINLKSLVAIIFQKNVKKHNDAS